MAIFNMVQGKVPMTYRGTKTIALFHFDDYIDNKTPVATVGNGMVNGTISPYLGIAHFGIVGKIDGGDNLKYKTSDLSFGTGPFTIEFFFFKNVWDTTSPLSRVDVSDNENVNKTYIYLSLTSSWTYHFNVFGGNLKEVKFENIPSEGWIHVALVGNGKQNAARAVDLFLNGSKLTTIQSNYDFKSANTLKISPINISGHRLLIDELRISNVVRYTTNFTPPTAPFAPD